MRYLTLPVLFVLGYLAAGQGDAGVPADAARAAAAPVVAAAPEVPAQPPQSAPEIDVKKPLKPTPVLIDDTPLAPQLLRTPALATGRFWIETLPNNYIVLLDTQTGHCWTRSLLDRQWQSLGSPVKY